MNARVLHQLFRNESLVVDDLLFVGFLITGFPICSQLAMEPVGFIIALNQEVVEIHISQLHRASPTFPKEFLVKFALQLKHPFLHLLKRDIEKVIVNLLRILSFTSKSRCRDKISRISLLVLKVFRRGISPKILFMYSVDARKSENLMSPRR